MRRRHLPLAYCPTFDGDNDYMSIAAHADLNDFFATPGASIACWFRTYGKGDANPYLWGKTDSVTGPYVYLLDGAGDTFQLVFGQSHSTTHGTWLVGRTFEYSRRELVRLWVAYDSSSLSNDPIIYVDGVKYTVGAGLTEVTTPVGTPGSDAANVFTIGSLVAGFGFNNYKGQVRDLCFLNSVISDANALLDYQFNAFADSDFVARYKLGDSNYPTDTAANVGTGGAGAATVSGVVSESSLVRF